MAFTFKKASTKQAKLRASLTGPAGAGKTLGSLLLARGLVGPSGRIALIDTEHLRAEAYANVVDFDVAALDPPFSPERYIEAFESAWGLGYDALVVDSLSHAWAGTGGVRQIVDREKEKSQGTNKDWRAWAKGSDMQQRLVDKIVGSPTHIICTIRTKMATAFVDGKVVKVGLEAVQREGIEYEYDLVLDVNYDHDATVSKCNTTWSRQVQEALAVERKVTFDLGRKIRTWIESAPPAAAPDPVEILRSRLLDRAANELPPARIAKFGELVRGAKDMPELEHVRALLEKALEKINEQAAAPPVEASSNGNHSAAAAPQTTASAGNANGGSAAPAPARSPAPADASPPPAAPAAPIAAVERGGGAQPGEGARAAAAAPVAPPPAQPLAAAMNVPAEHALAPDAVPAAGAASSSPAAPAATPEPKGSVTVDEVLSWIGELNVGHAEAAVKLLDTPKAVEPSEIPPTIARLIRYGPRAVREDVLDEWWKAAGGTFRTVKVKGKPVKDYGPMTAMQFTQFFHAELRPNALAHAEVGPCIGDKADW